MKIGTFEIEAINQLAPNANYRTSDSKIIWDSPDIAQPSEEDIITKANELEAEYDAQEYARNRQYPPLGDQLDDLYHAGVFSAEMTAKLKKVKDDNPK